MDGGFWEMKGRNATVIERVFENIWPQNAQKAQKIFCVSCAFLRQLTFRLIHTLHSCRVSA
jgi:hypothetical protein